MERNKVRELYLLLIEEDGAPDFKKKML